MNVAYISKSDALGGGASRTAQDLTAALNAMGHAATHFCASAGGGWTSTRRPLYGPAWAARATTAAHRAMQRTGFGELIPFEFPAAYLQGIARDYDIVHFHDLMSSISPVTVRLFSHLRPTFWTFHDCSPVTGGCNFPFDCERFTSACGTQGGCPQLPSYSLTDQTGMIQAVKASLHRSRRVTTVAGSPWMVEMAVRSGKVVDAPTVVPYSADTDLFVPASDRAALRRELGLPVDAPVILVSGAHLADERKGIRYSLAAARACADLSPFVLLIGSHDANASAMLGPIAHKATGYVTDQRELARWYAAADVFLFCSLAETGPLSVVETMACGTPFVGFTSGGIPEMVVQDETGLVVRSRDEAALAEALRRALDGRAVRWGKNARQRAVERYSYRAYALRHLELYETALASRRT